MTMQHRVDGWWQNWTLFGRVIKTDLVKLVVSASQLDAGDGTKGDEAATRRRLAVQLMSIMIARTLHYEQFRELRLEVDTTDVEGDPIISDEQWPILLHDSPSQILQPRRSPSAKRKDTPNKFQQFAQRDLIKLTDRVSAVLNLRNANSGDVPYSTADVKLAQRCVQRAGHAQEAMSASGVWEWLLAEQEEERARETDAMDVAQSAGVQPEERDNGQPQGNHESDDAVEDMEVDSNTPSALASAVNEGDSLQII